MEKGFRQMLAGRQQEISSLVCVGIDPLEEKIPECIKERIRNGPTWYWVIKQMEEIIDATAEYVCMYKLQRAHFEAIPGGQKALQALVDYIHSRYPEILVFLDCKRGDIDRTQKQYRIAHFEIDGVDGMDFNPYMGKDCLEQLVDKSHLERAIVGLCYTSNPSARHTQDVKLADGRSYWEFMAATILQWAEELGVVENAGLVMAAAYEAKKGSGEIFSWHLSRCREIVSNKLWFLIPGIGTQGGFVLETVKAAYAGAGSIAINSSSAITFASSGPDFAEAAGRETKKLRDQINEIKTNVLFRKGGSP